MPQMQTLKHLLIKNNGYFKTMLHQKIRVYFFLGIYRALSTKI